MRVLSLFDGMSCGQLALQKLGITPEKYYASEIDKNPILITQKNFPNTIQLGDVSSYSTWNIEWDKIDLVFAGFPCQAWSVSGKKLGDKDERGKLFWTMLDVIKKVKEYNPNVIFLIENVKMPNEFESYITKHTENALEKVHKYLICSSLVSAQKRKRFYWTNIPNVNQPEDKRLLLKDILKNDTKKDWLPSEKSQYLLNIAGLPHKERKDFVKRNIAYKSSPKEIPLYHFIYPNHLGQNGSLHKEKSATLTCAARGCVVDQYEGEKRVRFLSLNELERLQNLPDDYTKGVSVSHRKKMIGNGWTVDVIVHILSNLSLGEK